MAKKKIAATLRKPPSPRGLEDLDVFVEAGVAPPRRTSIHEVRPSAMPKSSTPKSSPMRQLEVELDAALVEQLNLHCLSNYRELDAVVAEAIRQHLRPTPEPASLERTSARPARSPRSRPRPSQAELRGAWQAFGFVD